MGFFADLHIHSKYSRATSPNMVLDGISKSAKEKGIELCATGDFTHPLWRKELKEKLKPTGKGLFIYNGIHFVLEVEVNNVYVKNGRIRKVHILIFAPDFDEAEKISNFLSRYGKLESDGRPTLSLDSEIMAKRIFDLSPDAVIIPAHIWTPWFGLLGAKSGFNKIEECFGEETKNIFAVETGLSSDPPMNWRLSSLDSFALVSNSDAHSPKKLGREANYLECEIDYSTIFNAIRSKDKEKFKFTVEFFPQEGKYYWDGHRKCNARISPEEAEENGNICPRCGKPITIGVMHRVLSLSDRKEGIIPPDAIPCKHLIPLREIIADALSMGVDSIRVEQEYMNLVHEFGSEFACLLDVSFDDLLKVTNKKIAQGIIKVRNGNVKILPGYDGVYGEIKIFDEKQKEPKQMSLF
jgi:uncharacterized protein (TIGR00375 family)